MALDTVEAWKAKADEGMLTRLKEGPLPSSFKDCWRDLEWRAMIELFAKEEYSPENLDFLAAVDDFKTQGDATTAAKIYEMYVVPSGYKQVNLYEDNHKKLTDFFEGKEPSDVPREIFDPAYEEITQVVEQDTWRRFSLAAGAVGPALAREEAGPEEAEAQIDVSAPRKVEMSPDKVDRSVVDNWNEEALKSLGQGESTHFYEIGDLIIIDAKKPEVQPYIGWATNRDEVDLEAAIFMVKKGGAFDPGSISARGVQNRGNFAAAIKRVSKKKILYT